MPDYIVVGSGFAGSVIAERIANVLDRNVLVIEKRSHVGGNCYDSRDATGILVHRYGPHLFHTNRKDVFDYLSGFTGWRTYHHRVLACVGDRKIPLPFDLKTLHMVFPEETAAGIESRLVRRYQYGTKVPILDLMKEDDPSLRLLADYIYNNIFLNYTAKQWGVRPEDVDPAVTARVPVLVGRNDGYFDDRYQAVPEEGYSRMFECMLDHPKIELMPGTDSGDVLSVNPTTGRIYFKGVEFRGKVVFTGMIDELFGFKLGALSYRSLDLEFETLDQEYYQEVATVNYPNDHAFTRITEFRHIHPVDVNRTVILKEYPKTYRAGRDIPYYPALTNETADLYEKYKALAARSENLVLVGRLAEYKYYDMDDIVKRSLDLFEEEIR
ncbi:MAG: UDP-galactopyranose mutase [Deltaproteobacteria bacterium]|nr:UDP-galactopyranose mutase [Deltaproteobacteria bacterium]